MKNKDLIAANIQEAKVELEEMLSDLAKDPEYSEAELKLALEHAYHHLNFAWHIRAVDEDRAAKCSEEDFLNWSKFPTGEMIEYE